MCGWVARRGGWLTRRVHCVWWTVPCAWATCRRRCRRSVGSLVAAAPYYVRMFWHGLWHGYERPARPNIPPEVWEWYTPRPSDVIISPAAKSGTTWLLQIAHQLRVKGEEPTWDDQVRVCAVVRVEAACDTASILRVCAAPWSCASPLCGGSPDDGGAVARVGGVAG